MSIALLWSYQEFELRKVLGGKGMLKKRIDLSC